MLTTNLDPSLGLANGTPVEMHSICFHPDDRQRVRHLLENSDDTDIHLDHQPIYLAVRVLHPIDDLQKIKNNSLSPEDGVVIPVYPRNTSNYDKHRVTAGIAKIVLRALPHGIDPAFSITVHKIQGQTCEKLIIDLNKSPVKPKLNFQGLLVLLSRVRRAADLRLLPLRAGNFNYRHLLELEPPPALVQWLNSLQSPRQEEDTAAPSGIQHTSGTQDLPVTVTGKS